MRRFAIPLRQGERSASYCFYDDGSVSFFLPRRIVGISALATESVLEKARLILEEESERRKFTARYRLYFAYYRGASPDSLRDFEELIDAEDPELLGILAADDPAGFAYYADNKRADLSRGLSVGWMTDRGASPSRPYEFSVSFTAQAWEQSSPIVLYKFDCYQAAVRPADRYVTLAFETDSARSLAAVWLQSRGAS